PICSGLLRSRATTPCTQALKVFGDCVVTSGWAPHGAPGTLRRRFSKRSNRLCTDNLRVTVTFLASAYTPRPPGAHASSPQQEPSIKRDSVRFSVVGSVGMDHRAGAVRLRQNQR